MSWGWRAIVILGQLIYLAKRSLFYTLLWVYQPISCLWMKVILFPLLSDFSRNYMNVMNIRHDFNLLGANVIPWVGLMQHGFGLRPNEIFPIEQLNLFIKLNNITLIRFWLFILNLLQRFFYLIRNSFWNWHSLFDWTRVPFIRDFLILSKRKFPQFVAILLSLAIDSETQIFLSI